MTSPNDAQPQDAIRAELDAAQASFHRLVEDLSEEDWRRQSLNPGWTNGEVMAHMLFGFIVVAVLAPLVRLWGRLPKASSRPFAGLLNASTRPFNWINKLGARAQARVFTRRRIAGLFDRVHGWLLAEAAAIEGEEWGRGMHFPARWDATNFRDFMTIEEVFHYPVRHYEFHLGQLAR
jgi:hypothetical protein